MKTVDEISLTALAKDNRNFVNISVNVDIFSRVTIISQINFFDGLTP